VAFTIGVPISLASFKITIIDTLWRLQYVKLNSYNIFLMYPLWIINIASGRCKNSSVKNKQMDPRLVMSKASNSCPFNCTIYS
jgi:hypothetical protein